MLVGAGPALAARDVVRGVRRCAKGRRALACGRLLGAIALPRQCVGGLCIAARNLLGLRELLRAACVAHVDRGAVSARLPRIAVAAPEDALLRGSGMRQCRQAEDQREGERARHGAGAAGAAFGLAWIFIIARSIGPSISRSSASSERSTHDSIASRCSGEGLHSTQSATSSRLPG